jgi:hypothetical protein
MADKGFRRVSLVGSEELFRPTRPDVVETEDTITEVVEARRADKSYRTLHLTPDEVELLLDAIQVAKYPDRPRPKPPLEKHDRLDALRNKLQPRE